MVFKAFAKDLCRYTALVDRQMIDLYFQTPDGEPELLVSGEFGKVYEEVKDYIIDDVPDLWIRIRDFYGIDECGRSVESSQTLAIEDLSYEELRKLYVDVSKRYHSVATAAFEDRVAKLVNDIESIKKDFPYCSACYTDPRESGKYNIFDQDWVAANFFWDPKNI